MIKTILIVEDDPFIALDLQDIFEDAGFKVLGPVAQLGAAMEISQDVTIDVAMLDYNLGHETSIPLAVVLEEREIPYLFLTGQISKVVLNRLKESRKVISKPFDPENLVKSVENLFH